MSRLPTLSTPGRSANSSPGSGIPTPSIRRPRSSLGPGALPTPGSKQQDAEMDSALKDLLGRHRPGSSLGSIKDREDPETPTASGRGAAGYLAPGTGDGARSLHAPRTPAFRPRTPSSVNTPSYTPTSRPGSRPTMSARPSLAASANTPRRPSAAASTSTPYTRPESRAGAQDKWIPAVGDRVRLPSHGYEGTLRYLGTTHIRDGIWAGVELEGAFKGRGRNDGTVDGHEYFKCAPNCGIFALAEKLAPPTSSVGPSRPASVASHRSLTSSYSASGRQTPAAERTRRAGATTPGLTRSMAARPKEDATQTPTDAGRRTLLGNSTATNAARAEARITAGSRASKYLGMTAKQLEERSGTTPPTKLTSSTLGSSTSTPTPRMSKMGATTPARSARPSMGLATPKARGPRMSSAVEMMPPPPSPQVPKVASGGAAAAAAAAAASAAATAALEEEIQKLRRRNTELEEQASSADPGADIARIEDLERELERMTHEAGELRNQLSTSNGDATDVRQQAEELQANEGKLQADLDAKMVELLELRREMELAAERSAGELEAGMEAKREEVRGMEERAQAAEHEAGELKKLVDELTLAGNQIIELNETKAFSYEQTIRELTDKLDQANEDLETKAAAPADPDTTPREATAAEIDNETLTAQVKHLQNRILGLEEQLEEARGQAESDSDAWQGKYTKARENEKALAEQLEVAKAEISKLNEEDGVHSARETELKGALAENQAALETARAEIETFRAEASEAATRSATSKESPVSETEMAELQSRLVSANTRTNELEEQVSELETEVATLRTKAVETSPGARSRQSRMSNGSIDDPKILGYHHIVNDMKAENSQLKAEIDSLKEEIKLLQELNEAPAPAANVNGHADETAKLRAEMTKQGAAMKEYEREVSELESLIESKIYREDELETRLQELERDVDRWRAKAQALAAGSAASSAHSRSTSLTSNGVASIDETRCELCEGPHDLDACPVFAGTTLSADAAAAGDGGSKKKWCNDCESDAHNTAECPMADDMF